MGMFDELKCEYPMPKGYEFLQNKSFQTKTFDNLMDEYVITEDGRLIRTITEWEPVPKEERLYYGTPEWDKNPMFQIIGSIKVNKVGQKEIPYHGDVYFHTLFNNKFYDFKARFTEGVLNYIVLEKETCLNR